MAAVAPGDCILRRTVDDDLPGRAARSPLAFAFSKDNGVIEQALIEGKIAYAERPRNRWKVAMMVRRN